MNDNINFQTTFLVERIAFVNKDKKGNFNFVPEISIAFNKLEENKWKSTIAVRVLDKDDHPFPFDLDVVVSLLTTFPNGYTSDFNLEEYLRFNSLNILYPYVRSVVTNITGAALINPMFLPIVDINKIGQDVEIPGLKK